MNLNVTAASILGLALFVEPDAAQATYFVPDDHLTIAAAIGACVDGDTVLVRAGTWLEHDLDFGGRRIRLASTDGAAATTIDAQGLGRHFTFGSGEGPECVLEGFTLIGGQAPPGADSPGAPIWGTDGDHGGSVYLDQTSPTIRDCVFRGNRAGAGGVGGDGAKGSSAGQHGGPGEYGTRGGDGGHGGAIYVFLGEPTIERCTFEANEAGAGGLGGTGGKGGDGDAASPPFYAGGKGGPGGNGGSGGAGGDGGAVAVWGFGLHVETCLFLDNEAGRGGAGGPGGAGGSGGQGSGSWGSLGNPGWGGDGGGIWCQGSGMDVVHSLFFANAAGLGGSTTGTPAGGGGGVWGGGTPGVRNSILWGNTPDQANSLATVVYSDVEGGFTGVGNIDADPQFFDSANGDFHLVQTSDCVDAGDPTLAGLPSTDFEGDPRVVGAGPDMGPDEVAVLLVGTGEDLRLETLVAGAGVPLDHQKVATAGDSYTVAVDSPLGVFVGASLLLGMQPYLTGSPFASDPGLPGVHLNPMVPGLVLVVGANPGPFGHVLLAPDGLSMQFTVPPGLGGVTVRTQAIVMSALASNGLYAATDCHELHVQ